MRNGGSYKKERSDRIARKCKCQVTGEQGTTDIFYKADNGKYYKTKEIYDEYLHEKEVIEEVKDILYEDFFGYAHDQPRSTWGYAELSKLHKFYHADTILHTIELKSDAIRYAVKNKTFKNEHAMMSYVFAIIKNNIKAVYDKERRQAKTVQPIKEYEVIEQPPDDVIVQDIHVDTAKDLSEIIFGDGE